MRLAHIAAIMLPLINVVVGRELDRLVLSAKVKRVTSVGLLASAVGLPLSLALEALSPLLATLHLSGVPALTLTASLVSCAIGAARSTTSMGGRFLERLFWRVAGWWATRRLSPASGSGR